MQLYCRSVCACSSVPRSSTLRVALGARRTILTSAKVPRLTLRRIIPKATDDDYAKVVEPKSGVRFPATCQTCVRVSSLACDATPSSLTTSISSAVKAAPDSIVAKLSSGKDSLQVMRSMGAACREKGVLLINVQVYAISLYVEGIKATREIGIRSRGGMFTDAQDDEYCDALMDGSFAKMLAVRMLRDVEGAAFVEALDEALLPRMSMSGEAGVLEEFKSFFLAKELKKDMNILLLWQPAHNSLQIRIIKDGSWEFAEGKADLELNSASLCRALFEVWMGSNPIIPEAKHTFAKGACNLVERDERYRSQFKPGGRMTPNP